MFEFHGWATVRETAGCADLRSDPSPETVERIRQLTAEISDHNRHANLRWANGDLQLSLGGLHNHRQDRVTTFFAEVAKAAPGSYGMLYLHDDEDPSMPNAWRRLVLRRGALHEERDTSLSPHIGLVEDDCDYDDPNGNP